MFFAVAFLSNSLVPVWADTLRRENDRLTELIEDKEFDRVVLLYKAGRRIPVAPMPPSFEMPPSSRRNPLVELQAIDRSITEIRKKIPDGAKPEPATANRLRALEEVREHLQAELTARRNHREVEATTQQKRREVDADEGRTHPELAVYWRRNRALKTRLAIAEHDLAEAIGDRALPGPKRR